MEKQIGNNDHSIHEDNKPVKFNTAVHTAVQAHLHRRWKHGRDWLELYYMNCVNSTTHMRLVKVLLSELVNYMLLAEGQAV